MKRGACVTIIGLLVIALLAFFGWRAIQPSGTSPVEVHAASAASKQALSSPKGIPALVRPTSTTQNFGPLPPLDAPLASSYRELLRRANAGDPRAACRLSAELEICSGVKERLAGALGFVRRADPRRDPVEVAATAESLQRLAKADADHCEGFVDSERVPAWQYLYWAASHGHVPSMARFAIAPPIHPVEMLADPEGKAVYRLQGAAMLRAAADAGNPAAVRHLADVASGGLLMERVDWAGVSIAPVDQRLAARYAIAAQQLPPRDGKFMPMLVAKLSSLMSPEDMARARAEADELARRWPPEVFEPKASFVPGQLLPRQRMDCNE